MTRPLRPFVPLLVLAASLAAATPCPQPHEIQPSETLNSIAAGRLGSSRYAVSIALATNARTADGFRYIANPDDLSGVSRVCIPAKREARELDNAWTAYARAVDQARLPRAANLGSNLVTIPLDQPVDLVAWVRRDQADRLKTSSGSWIESAPSETWVTVEPHLQSFCREYVRSRKPDDAALTRRLEQRLGLSPASSKTSFVRIRLLRPNPNTIFRPCTDPAADQANCALGPPAKAPPAHQQWLFQQFYSSYGQSLISEFPWTDLGYTFDWAPGAATGFERTGETEFVIRRNAPWQIEEVVDTTHYCTPPGPQ